MTIKHILSVNQFDKHSLHAICRQADQYMQDADIPIGAPSWAKLPRFGRAHGKLLANLFYEPSTRTSSSFYAAMIRLGGNVIPINNVQYSSVAKGETLEGTIRTMQCYVDVIVLRHNLVGAADRAAAVASVPIINAGDGDNEHPTQALLDFYTIQKELTTIDSLHVVMMGDLLRGRTVKSLAKLLRNYKVKITWVSPDELRVPPDYVAEGEIQTNDLTTVINSADVLYVTRVQHERSIAALLGDTVYGVSVEHMNRAPKHMLLMHPLPRLSELPTELDTDPRAAYFRQMTYGMYLRMALLSDVLKCA